ncbi:hypothetical protein ACNPQM_35835 [Streptomyces sp. NPDC056231]|uniref:hypothetical protein n=1 Tax=Streptomyces sp. NPDC056231 TaxID=3345755 RepID=UPI003AB049C7
MSKRTAARRQTSKKEEEQQPEVEFRARGLHIRLNHVPSKLISALVGAVITWLITGRPWML